MTLRNILIGAAAAAALTGLSTANAAGLGLSANGTATASATIQAPVAIGTATSNLAFGTIIKPSSGSATVTFDPSTGKESMTGGGALAGGTPALASFPVTGPAGSYSPTATLTFGGDDSVLHPSPLVASSITLADGTTTNVPVGGTITVPSTATAKLYSGTLTLTINY